MVAARGYFGMEEAGELQIRPRISEVSVGIPDNAEDEHTEADLISVRR